MNTLSGKMLSYIGNTRRGGRRYGMSKQAHKALLRACCALFLIPAAWGLCFGLAFSWARDGSSAPYDWMKEIAVPITEVLSHVFPVIDNVTRDFYAHGYGGRAEFGRCVAGMTMFFMTLSGCISLAYALMRPKRMRLQMALENIERISSIKWFVCLICGLAMFWYMAYQIAVVDLLIDWDPRPSRSSIMWAIHQADWVAGFTMASGVAGGWMPGGSLIVLDTIVIGIKRKSPKLAWTWGKTR